MQPYKGQRGPRIWVPVLGVAVIAAAGGLVGRELYQRPAVQTSAVQEIPAPPSTTVQPAEQPGSPQVKATRDVAEHPQAGPIWVMLQTHFDSINEKDYDKWRTTVTKARAAGFEQKAWSQDYRSTKDGSILIHRIDAAPDRKLRVMVSFTSTQDVADAPWELPKPCIHWHIVLPLTREDNKWKIDVGPEGASPRHEECGAEAN